MPPLAKRRTERKLAPRAMVGAIDRHSRSTADSEVGQSRVYPPDLRSISVDVMSRMPARSL
jgi:hypothetical protein